jgi:hypothetical protein
MSTILIVLVVFSSRVLFPAINPRFRTVRKKRVRPNLKGEFVSHP